MGGVIISGIVLGFCALIMFATGIAQMKSKEPVGFWTEKAPPEKETVSDVRGWNRKHGMMWLLYGVCLLGAWAGCLLLRNSVYVLLPLLAGVLAPVALMIFYHRRLVRRYIITANTVRRDRSGRENKE